MPYIKNTYTYPDGTIEVEKVFSPRYGRNISNGPRKKPTSEEVAKVNMRNMIKKLTRTIRANFCSDDYHLTLTYKKDNRPSPEEAKKVLKKYIAKLRKEYKTRGHPLKYIIVTEYHNKAIHHHMIINNPDNFEKLIRKTWEGGGVNFSPLYENGDYDELAAYLVKEVKKTRTEKKNKPGYTRSRNLIEPTLKREIVHSQSWREQPPIKKGYFLDKNSLVQGISELTGMPYQYYRLIKIKRRD